jgi:hypothetical protein
MCHFFRCDQHVRSIRNVSCSGGSDPAEVDAAIGVADATTDGSKTTDARCGELKYELSALLDSKAPQMFDSPIRDLFGHEVKLAVDTMTTTTVHRTGPQLFVTGADGAGAFMTLRTDAVVQSNATALRDAVMATDGFWQGNFMIFIGNFTDNTDSVSTFRGDKPDPLTRFGVGVRCSGDWPHISPDMFPMITSAAVPCELMLDDLQANGINGQKTAARVSGTGMLKITASCPLL